jgi:hypothetical protein
MDAIIAGRALENQRISWGMIIESTALSWPRSHTGQHYPLQPSDLLQSLRDRVAVLEARGSDEAARDPDNHQANEPLEFSMIEEIAND